MGQKQYWAVGASFGQVEDKSKEFIDEGYWYDGYSDSGDYRYAGLLEQVNIGDILCMKSSATKGPGKTISFTRLKHVGVVTSRESEYCFWVDWLKIDKLPLDFDDIYYAKTIQLLRDDEMKAFVKEEIYKLNGGKTMDKYVSLLEANKNLILTGAPGTGKTFLAKKIAMQMIGVKNEDELIKNGQFEMVQFHPSYDYTDFVEGLRPTKPDEKGNIGFELKDGIFRNFCKNAIGTIAVENIEEFSLENYEKYLYSLGLNEITIKRYMLRIDQLLNKKELNSKRKIENKEIYSSLDEICENIEDIKDFDIINKFHYQFYGAVSNLQDFKGSLNNKEHIIDKNNIKYIFLIDEINRGEIPKIFGELFFSIDPGYRGIKGKVKTQYSSMRESDDYLYIPENVYIIGTMNDIDRSVESFDFAMRRRFVWKEITAEESADNMGLQENTRKRMTRLNEAISKIDGLGSSYHIGGVYFLKKDEKGNIEEPEYSSLWDLRLEPLLKEYLRGMSDAEDKLKDMKKAYYSE